MMNQFCPLQLRDLVTKSSLDENGHGGETGLMAELW